MLSWLVGSLEALAALAVCFVVLRLYLSAQARRRFEDEYLRLFLETPGMPPVTKADFVAQRLSAYKRRLTVRLAVLLFGLPLLILVFLIWLASR